MARKASHTISNVQAEQGPKPVAARLGGKRTIQHTVSKTAGFFFFLGEIKAKRKHCIFSQPSGHFIFQIFTSQACPACTQKGNGILFFTAPPPCQASAPSRTSMQPTPTLAPFLSAGHCLSLAPHTSSTVLPRPDCVLHQSLRIKRKKRRKIGNAGRD